MAEQTADKKYKVLLIGSGGREHALAWKLNASAYLEKLYLCAGSDAMAEAQLGELVLLDMQDFTAVAQWCDAKKIDLVIVGPEQPLSEGIADALQAKNIAVFGPNKHASQLESSKIWMKEFLQKHDIPTAKFASFTDQQSAEDYLDEYYQQYQGAIIIKTDGLAAGKGVVIAENHQQAKQAVADAMAGKFGDAGKKLLIEEFMAGEEISWFAISDGNTAQFLGTAQDYKRAYDNHQGPNTGGMGAFSPARQESAQLNQQIDEQILQKLMRGFAKENITYRGILFFGIMLTAQGPKVIEINIRFGDPECQVLLPRLQNDVLLLCYQAAMGQLQQQISLSDKIALTVIFAAKGYPADYQKNTLIQGIDENMGSDSDSDSHNAQQIIFHAGTKKQDGQYYANGGRVLNVTAFHQPDIQTARKIAYQAVQKIDWQEGFYRTDIGL